MGTLEAIPATLAVLMHLRGLSQGELARRSGIHKGQLSGYLNGRSRPQLEQLLRVMEGLEVEPVLFFAATEKVREVQRKVDRRVTGEVLRGADPAFAAVLRSAVGRLGEIDAAAEPDGRLEEGEAGWLGKLLRAQKLALESQRLFLEALEDRRRVESP